MKKIISIVAIVGSLSGILSASNFAVGVSGSDQGIDSFRLSIGNYYGVPQQEVREVEYYVPREHMSVIYFLADKSHRDSRYVTDLRRQGLSWWNISLRLGLDPYTLYRAPHSKYKRHRMHDAEIADYVNVRFLSDYHRVSRDEIIKRRHEGERYERIDNYYRGKQDHPHYNEQRREDRKSYKKDRKEDRRSYKEERRNDKDSRDNKKNKDNRDKERGNSQNR
jgi:hypothetical protein